jgi:hypothetical protein
MKVVFIIMFYLMIFRVSGQSRLGYSVNDIKKEFSDKSFALTSGYDSYNHYYLFNNASYCDKVLIIPDDNGKLNYFVEEYNKSYVIINNMEWKMYDEGGISSIRLVFPGDKGEKPFFVWTPND